MELIVRPDAEADINQGYLWYESQRQGLGEEFMAEVSAAMDAVMESPLRFPVVLHRMRRALLHRFPYGVFFVVHNDNIAVVAAMHLTRNPRRLRRRAE